MPLKKLKLSKDKEVDEYRFRGIYGDQTDKLNDYVQRVERNYDEIAGNYKKSMAKKKAKAEGREYKSNKPKTKKHSRFKRKNKKKSRDKHIDIYSKDVERTKGDSWIYFGLHSIIGSALFIFISLPLNLFNLYAGSVSSLFTSDFLLSLLLVLILSVGTNISGRIIAYLLLSLFYVKTIMKTPYELNFDNGINKIGTRYVVSILISSLIFSLGLIYILESKIFGDNTLTSFALTYLIIKFVVYTFTIILVASKG